MMQLETKEIVSVNSILSYLQEQVERKIPLAPSIWVDAAQKINVLLGDEHDKLYDLQQVIAKVKAEYIVKGDSVAKADALVRATDIYTEMKKQEAKIKRIEEFIRIAKIQARLKETEFRGY